jgi:hypothetical protein
MKWSHVDRMEQIWIQRKIGDELYKEINQPWCRLVLLRSNSQTLPADIYKRVDIYVDIQDERHATLFALKFSKIRKLEAV